MTIKMVDRRHVLTVVTNCIVSCLFLSNSNALTQYKDEVLRFKQYPFNGDEFINQKTISLEGTSAWSSLPEHHKLTWQHRKILAENNLNAKKNFALSKGRVLKDGEVITHKPGDKAQPFALNTLSGGLLNYPGPEFVNCSVIFHVVDSDSAFLLALWSNAANLEPLFRPEAPDNAHYVFISKRSGVEDKGGAKWIQARLQAGYQFAKLKGDRPVKPYSAYKFHISVNPLYQIGNYITDVLQQWECVDHNCGLDQVLITGNDVYPKVFMRLDARYDWLPSPVSVFGNKTRLPLMNAGNGCTVVEGVKQFLAFVQWGGCNDSTKVGNMAKSGALGMVVMMDEETPIRDLNCDGDCNIAYNIPATTIPYSANTLWNVTNKTLTFQNTPSSNFFMAIDVSGNVAEMGWFLYPTAYFLMWQAQWFNYKWNVTLKTQNSASTLVVPVFKNQVMKGQQGAQTNVTMPDYKELIKYKKIELDVSLGCYGDRDTDCPHWDRIVSLFVCCNPEGVNCNYEIGRWITPFRRRVGRWLTDISPLLPLLVGEGSCNFTMKTDFWAMPWLVSVSVRLSGLQENGLFPASVMVLYEPGAKFDKFYNSHFKPLNVHILEGTKQVLIFAVITGHGSDENGCGEFCVTSHHFVVNNFTNNITFSDAGTLLGCAEQVPSGVEPNEHGTWLYGRDGRNVFPWIINVTDQVRYGTENTLRYFGWFNGTDPNPQKNPGDIVMYSYLIFYKDLP